MICLASNSELRQFDAAIESYKKALEINPNYAEAYYNMGNVLNDKGDSEAAEIKVSDNGAGFHGDIARQAFEPYVTTKAKGTGLGLAIVKKLIDEHGGRIAACNGEQGGAEISILIPIIEKAGSATMMRMRRQKNWSEGA